MSRIALWSGPRNVSTALMYAFAQRPDTQAVDEPLYGSYLARTGAMHPGREVIIENMELDAAVVLESVFFGQLRTEHLFVKNMAHHLSGLDTGFLSRLTNVLLIRDPEQMLPSLVNQVPEPELADTGLGFQVAIYAELDAEGKPPPVIDSRELLLDPPGVLEKLCERLGLQFQAGMLEWPAGPKPEDGVWAPHWYHSVHKSTGFQKYQAKTEPFPDRLRPLLAECRPLYAQLYRHAIRAEQ